MKRASQAAGSLADEFKKVIAKSGSQDVMASTKVLREQGIAPEDIKAFLGIEPKKT
jgi:predicted PP-loop superfamily ATPase